jgi:4-aminobutyrate---pyruvate transaminase
MTTNRPASDTLAALDRVHLVHPVSAWRQHEARGPMVLASGRGAWLTDQHGHELLDAFAGLWCVNVGYGQDSVVEAAAAQMRKLPYATGYFGFASEPAIRLAAKLAEITPRSLTRAYLTLGGSEAVDAAVRFIVQYWNARGRPTKKQFIALERGYHGSSSTGAGLTALPVFHRGFDLPLKTQHYIVIRRAAMALLLSQPRSPRCTRRWPSSVPTTSPRSSASRSRAPAA